jgi:hypothetical protein
MPSAYHPPSFTSHLVAAQASVIYHYTNQSGFVGIFENREFWATNIRYMNDATEFSYVFKLTEECLEKEEGNGNDLSQRKLRANLMRRFSNASKKVNVCVVCFCTNGDLLSQWRGYSGGSCGYSIGFNIEKLKNLVKSANFLGNCIYEQSHTEKDS